MALMRKVGARALLAVRRRFAGGHRCFHASDCRGCAGAASSKPCCCCCWATDDATKERCNAIKQPKASNAKLVPIQRESVRAQGSRVLGKSNGQPWKPLESVPPTARLLMHKMKSARPTSSLLFAEERELGLGFRQLLKSFSLAFIDQLIERFEYFPSQIPFLFREVRT